MSKEKQIEEMSALIYDNRPIPQIWNEDADSIAETLYNAGYRKQSEGEWNDDCRCSICDWYMPFDCKGDAFPTLYCPNCGAKMKGGAE